jgi:hypothetical protein
MYIATPAKATRRRAREEIVLDPAIGKFPLAFPAKAGTHSAVTRNSKASQSLADDDQLVPRDNGPRLSPGKRIK